VCRGGELNLIVHARSVFQDLQVQMPLVLDTQRAWSRVNVGKDGAFHPSFIQLFLPDLLDPFQLGLYGDAEFEP